MRYSQFFENDAGRLSMTRLVVFATFVPATWVLLHDFDQLTTYLGFYIGGYAAGKVSDTFMKGNSDVDISESETTIIRASSHSADRLAPDNQPLARKSKPIRRGKNRPF